MADGRFIATPCVLDIGLFPVRPSAPHPCSACCPRPTEFADAATADEDGDFVDAEASAWCQGHGFPWMCEGDYKPGRGLVGEVHAPEV